MGVILIKSMIGLIETSPLLLRRISLGLIVVFNTVFVFLKEG